MMTTLCGTPQYVAPEIILQSTNPQSTTVGYGKEVDMWSLGVILYVLLSGIPPFHEKRPIPLFQQIERALVEYPQEYWAQISPIAKDLINNLLVTDPTKRITVEEALRHPWLEDTSMPLATITNVKNNYVKNITLSPIKAPILRAESDTEDELGTKIKKRRPLPDGKENTGTEIFEESRITKKKEARILNIIYILIISHNVLIWNK